MDRVVHEHRKYARAGLLSRHAFGMRTIDSPAGVSERIAIVDLRQGTEPAVPGEMVFPLWIDVQM